MRILLVGLFLLILNCTFAQDTVKLAYDIYIYKDKKLMQKEFYISKNYIRVVYEYNEDGILLRRFWYNKEGRIIGLSLDY